VQGVFVVPGEGLDIAALADDPGRRFDLAPAAGAAVERGPNAWTWRAPRDKGLYRLRVADTATRDSMVLHAFVMVPAAHVRDGKLNGYSIGRYPDEPLRGEALYAPPAGFVEVTPENRSALVSPHFRLEQFLCKQAGGHPKYVLLQEKLVLELESILSSVRASGIEARTLHVMSGYRTPSYNAGLGNVRYSTHQWGAAADIFVDDDGDDCMDDLNRDGRVDRGDAARLFELIESRPRPEGAPAAGGLAHYEANRAHGPFVHVDVRGWKARWGS
jgi:hypothetical protein